MQDPYLGSGDILLKAIKAYGRCNLKKAILEDGLSTKDLANSREKYWIKTKRLEGKAEYNIADGGQGGDLGPAVRLKISESVRNDAYRCSLRFAIIDLDSKRIFSCAREAAELLDISRHMVVRICKGLVLPKHKYYRLQYYSAYKNDELPLCDQERPKYRRTAKHEANLLAARQPALRAQVGTHWFNDGHQTIRAYICPLGCVPGKLGRRSYKPVYTNTGVVYPSVGSFAKLYQRSLGAVSRIVKKSASTKSEFMGVLLSFDPFEGVDYRDPKGA